jgi:1,2-dihydroxy-3-keto-5-methylthiopentene dioxygenase
MDLMVVEINNPPEDAEECNNNRVVLFDVSTALPALNKPLKDDDDQQTILEAYQHSLSPYMEKHGYNNADVINVHKGTPNIEEIRKKFLSEHIHDEDEVRFFVDGEGEFFFHIDQVFSVICKKGDFISVPKGHKHWFDLAPKYHVKAIRVFQTKEGWVARYTESGKEKKYLK